MSAANSEAIVKPEANPDNYVWYLFYYNPNDERAIVPKRCKWLGWTINFGSRKGQCIGALFAGAIAGCVYYCYNSDKKCHYSFSELYEKIAAKFGKN
ncbi:hypothetical protein AV274_1530 [Blastocystis sp. ATCC 50177/Nand II]|uniref:DUF5808 domain-containing protein n=1 Tax=Blastocystis sp. subtype 1 (strain ATCC 50177 / NandII) TaxID=478820 RepID=A0A196SLF1_BLAHN|nr:hypothetical protein AV274_1530 [Blastocystis sp. ATCC 50177/Nand II]